MSYSFTPSRHSGYARSKDECEYPNLWPIIGWSPALQQQGGQVVKDVGSRYPGTMNNMEVGDWQTFAGWKALSCGGGNEYVATTNARLVDSASACRKYTLGMWTWKDGTYGPTKCGFTIPSALRAFEVQHYVGTGVYCIVPTGGGIAYGSVAFETNGWHHFMMVYDGYQSSNATRLVLYIDGIQKTLAFSGTIPAALDTFSANSAFEVGRYWNGSDLYLVGTYGDVVAYPRALHQREVLQLYHLGPGGWATPKKSRGRRVPTAPPAFTAKTFKAMRLAR